MRSSRPKIIVLLESVNSSRAEILCDPFQPIRVMDGCTLSVCLSDKILSRLTPNSSDISTAKFDGAEIAAKTGYSGIVRFGDNLVRHASTYQQHFGIGHSLFALSKCPITLSTALCRPMSSRKTKHVAFRIKRCRGMTPTR